MESEDIGLSSYISTEQEVVHEGRSIDYVFKIVVIGDSAVGKTQILMRFVRDEFAYNSKPTIGVEFQTRTLAINNSLIKAQVWDTAGQERYRAIASAYYRGALGAMLVYDITKRTSFDHIVRWLEELRVYADKSTVVMLIGNKTDLNDQRDVSTEDAMEFATNQGLAFFEASALSGENIETSFLTMVKEIYEIVSKKPLKGNNGWKERELNGEDGDSLLLRGTDIHIVPEESESEISSFKKMPSSCSC